MSESTVELTPEQCVPDVPDVSSLLKEKISKYGKKPEVNFFPPDFNVDVSKFFGFNFFSKVLGKGPGGMDYDTCAVTIEGDIDGAIEGGPLYPETMGGKLDGIDEELSALQGQIDELGDSAP